MIAILTTPRPDGVRYVDATVATVSEQRPPKGDCVIVSDGPWSGVVPAGWVVAEAPRASHAAAYWRMLRMAAAADEDLLALEDDIEICPGAVPEMLDFPVPPTSALVQFGSRVLAPGAPFDLYESSGGTLLGLWALKFPARTVKMLAEVEPRDRDAEEVLAMLLEGLGLLIGIHCPDLVRHVGVVSAGPVNRPIPQVTNWVPGLQLPLDGAKALGRYRTRRGST